MLSEFDYKLLDELSEKHLTLVNLLQDYGDAYVIRCRYEKLDEFGLVYESRSYIILTPLGKVELEDYRQCKLAKNASEKRVLTVERCAIASAVAAVASAICAIATLFK
mgnify:FL=1